MNKLLNALFFTSFLIFASCVSEVSSNEDRILGEDWEFRKKGDKEWLPASVPGCVHTDLLKNKKIEDPYYRMNEEIQQWIEKEDWEYICHFNTKSEATHHILKFEGLDTYAEVFLNNTKIISADNAFRIWQADVTNIIKPTGNELKLVFNSPIKMGLEKLRNAPYYLPANNEQAPDSVRTSVYTRKPHYQYGWDWGPRLVTSGIWKKVHLESWSDIKIEDAHYITKSITVDSASIKCNLKLNVATEGEYQIGIGNGVSSNKLYYQSYELKKGENELEIDFIIPKPKLWWPHNMGTPHVYSLVSFIEKEDQNIAKKNVSFGVREVNLITKADTTSGGTHFYFEVNGVPIFAKGANYIPSDIFPSSITRDIYRRDIKAALDANLNMLRVWGGAIYESDEFYQMCDQKGIMVWQDFMFSCNMYPEDKSFLENIKLEAEDNIIRLRNHPSLVMWCGNNEIGQAWEDWDWQEKYKMSKEDTARLAANYKKIFNVLLPNAVAKFDSQRAYWGTSPSADGIHHSNLKSGDDHAWKVWFSHKPFENYETEIARFVSEYGLQSYPELRSMAKFSMPSDLVVGSELIKKRQRSNMPWFGKEYTGTENMDYYISMYFKQPNNFLDKVYLSQCMQALGLQQATEIHRRNKPYCMGSLYWQLNDCWPAISWSTMDYYGNWKAAHYRLRKTNENLALSVSQKGRDINIHVISDLLKDSAATLLLRTMDFSGNTLYRDSTIVAIYSNVSSVQYSSNLIRITRGGNQRNIVMKLKLVTKDGEFITDYTYFFNDPKNLNLPKPEFEVQATPFEKGCKFVIKTSKVVRFVNLNHAIEGFFSDNYFDLIPGEEKEVILFTKESSTDFSKDLKIKSLYDTQ